VRSRSYDLERGVLKEDDSVEEGMGQKLASMGIAALLAIPGLFGAQQIEKSLRQVPPQKMNIKSKEVQDALKDAGGGARKGDLLPFQIVNLIARTLYAEGRGEGTEGLKAIMSVIMNRTGNDPKFVKDVLSEKNAFSCWNGVSDWDDVRYIIPKGVVSNPRDKAVWDECLRIAKEFYDGNFKSTIGNRNSYMNKSTADRGNVSGWGSKMDLKVGKHHFGYLREHDPKYVVPGTMKPRPKASGKDPGRTYKVVGGDTLSRIAKANKTTVGDLIAKNPDLKDPNSLKIGQVLKI